MNTWHQHDRQIKWKCFLPVDHHIPIVTWCLWCAGPFSLLSRAQFEWQRTIFNGTWRRKSDKKTPLISNANHLVNFSEHDRCFQKLSFTQSIVNQLHSGPFNFSPYAWVSMITSSHCISAVVQHFSSTNDMTCLFYLSRRLPVSFSFSLRLSSLFQWDCQLRK